MNYRKIENAVKSYLKRSRNLSYTLGLMVAFLISGNLSYSAEITINNLKEDTGLELGTDSRARGKGSIVTSNKGIAIGNNAVATGGVENKESIETKLAENKQKLDEIKTQEKLLNDKTEALREKQIRERETIEAGIRVEQILKSKEKAKEKWQKDLKAYNDLKDGSAEFFRENQAKIDDLNSRLAGLSSIQGVDISSDEGLTRAAEQLKAKAEQGTSLNLTLDFYKEYTKNYYKALGDLRENEIIVSKTNWSSFNDNNNNNQNSVINKYDYLSNASSWDCGIVKDRQNLTFYAFGFNLVDIKQIDNTITNPPTKTIANINHNTDITTLDKYNEIKEQVPKYKQTIREYFDHCNDRFLTTETKEKMYEMMDLKLDYKEKQYEIAAYQGEYEKTKNTTWLDKKKTALRELDDIKNKFMTIQVSLNELKDEEIEKWKKENITDIKEKNKVTIDKLTSELEQALGINKNAIKEREAEIARLKNVADQAERNYNGLNPSEKDKILAAEYERVRKEIDGLSKEIVQADERLKALKKALTLNDLANLGENNMALGTDSLAVKDDAIAIGTRSVAIGEQAISIGKESTVTGNSSIGIGKSNVIRGDNSYVLGTMNNIIGNDNIVLGKENRVEGTNVIAIGKNITTTPGNSIILGDNSTGVANALSIGSKDAERKLVNLAKGEISATSTDGVNGSQIYAFANNPTETTGFNVNNWKTALGVGEPVTVDTSGLVKLDGSNITDENKGTLKAKLDIGNGTIDDTESGNNTVTGKTVKTFVEGKGYITTNDLNKGELTSSDITVSGTGKLVDGNLTLSLKDNSISKDKLDTKLKAEIDGKASANDLDRKANTNLDNLTTDGENKIKGLITGGSTSDITTTIDNGVVKSTLDNTLKEKINKVDTIETDLSNKANTNLNNLTTDGENKIKGLITGGNTSDITTTVDNGVVKSTLDSTLKEKINKVTTIETDLNKKANTDLSNVSSENIMSKVTKGNITSSSLDITGGDNATLKNVTVELKTTDKEKIAKIDAIETKLDEKVDKTELAKDLDKKADKSELEKYVKLDGSNIDTNSKNAIVTKLNDGANISGANSGSKALVTDYDVKTYVTGLNLATNESLNNKANVDLDNLSKTGENKIKGLIIGGNTSDITTTIDNGVVKSTLDNTLKEKINKVDTIETDLSNKANADLSNVDKTIIMSKIDKGNLYSNTLKVLNGDGATLKNVTIELKDEDKAKIDLVDTKANINGSNIKTEKDKADFRNNINVYSKDEVETKLENIKAGTADLTGDITETEEKGVKGKVIHNHLTQNYVNKQEMAVRDRYIISNAEAIEQNRMAIAENNRRIDELEHTMKVGIASSAATAGIKYAPISTNEYTIGAAVAGYKNAQAVAVGVQVRPTENLYLHTSVSATSGRRTNAVWTVGAAYKGSFK